MDESASTVVVVGASAGGVEALTTLAGGLPQDLDAAICVVLHLPSGAQSRPAEILSRAGPLAATRAMLGNGASSGDWTTTQPPRLPTALAPATPSSREPARTTVTVLRPNETAALRKSTSIEGRIPFSCAPRPTRTRRPRTIR